MIHSKYFVHYIKKFIAFAFFNYDSTYPKYYNPAVIIPEIIISFLAILGIMKM